MAGALVVPAVDAALAAASTSPHATAHIFATVHPSCLTIAATQREGFLVAFLVQLSTPRPTRTSTTAPSLSQSPSPSQSPCRHHLPFTVPMDSSSWCRVSPFRRRRRRSAARGRHGCQHYTYSFPSHVACPSPLAFAAALHSPWLRHLTGCCDKGSGLGAVEAREATRSWWWLCRSYAVAKGVGEGVGDANGAGPWRLQPLESRACSRTRSCWCY